MVYQHNYFFLNTQKICIQMAMFSLFVFRKGGYNVNKCFSEAGCNEQTQIRVILSDTRLDPYKVLLNLTNLDSLWASYKQHCGKNV